MGLFSSKQKQQSYDTMAPWLPASSGLQTGAGMITDWMTQPLEYFPEQTYAGMTGAEQQAIDLMKQGAGAYPGMAAGYMDPAQAAFQSMAGATQDVMGMGLQDVYSNPALANIAQGIESSAMRNLEENILPQLKMNEGLYGSQEVAKGIAARGTQEALTENLANLYGGAWQAGLGAETARYGQALGAQAGALGALPTMTSQAMGMYTTPAGMLSQAGGLERAEEQRAIDEQMARFEFGQMEPLQRAQMGMGALLPAAQAFTMGSSQTKGTASPSMMSQIGMLGSGLAGLGGYLFPSRPPAGMP